MRGCLLVDEAYTYSNLYTTHMAFDQSEEGASILRAEEELGWPAVPIRSLDEINRSFECKLCAVVCIHTHSCSCELRAVYCIHTLHFRSIDCFTLCAELDA